MKTYDITKISSVPERIPQISLWFHQKWSVPQEEYEKSMLASISQDAAVPQWYAIFHAGRIIAGVGVIENDFHNRKDLAPNVCALYVEKEYRCLGIAGQMLEFVCNEFHEKGIDTLYLITDHASFYERYGWEFLCMVQNEPETGMARMYVHYF